MGLVNPGCRISGYFDLALYTRNARALEVAAGLGADCGILRPVGANILLVFAPAAAAFIRSASCIGELEECFR